MIASGTPVELIVSLDKWCKVRDSAGTISWIERKLSPRSAPFRSPQNGPQYKAPG